MIGCATTKEIPTAAKLVGKVERPFISRHYQGLLIKAGPEICKEAQKHEWDWHGYADKTEMRAGY